MGRGAWWLPSMGLQRVEHYWVTNISSHFTFANWSKPIGLPMTFILFILTEATLVHKFINFMWMTLHSYSCLHCSMLTTKNLVSIYHHTVDHLCPFHSPHPFFFSSNHLCIYVFGFVWFVHLFYFVYIPYMSEIMWCLSFSIWFISLSIILLRSIYMVANGKIPSFLWLSSIPLCIFIYTLMGT